MEHIYKSLNRIGSDRVVSQSDKLRLLEQGLVQRVSWGQYVLTAKGFKFLEVIERNNIFKQ